MRYAVISDIHANLEALKKVLAKIEELSVDRTICLGDLVGYNAHPNECVDMLRSRKIPTICGNHDAIACGLEEPWGFNPAALSAVMRTKEALSEDNIEWLKGLPDIQNFDSILAVHGSPSNRNSYLFTWEDVVPHLPSLAQRDCRLCFFGHTHVPGIFSRDGSHAVDNNSKFFLSPEKAFFVNPGSVGQPRDGDPRASFGVVDTDTNDYELVREEFRDFRGHLEMAVT